MLKDSRVKVNAEADGHSPLWRATTNGYLDIIKLWIASGREMDLGTPGDDETDVTDRAKKRRRTEVATLLERFQSDATQTRHAMRVEIGWYDETAARIFALVVFVSDGLLKTKATGVKAGAKRTQFLNMATSLPLELQMVLCYRVVGSPKEIIPGKDSEAAFKSLAKILCGPHRPGPPFSLLLGGDSGGFLGFKSSLGL